MTDLRDARHRQLKVTRAIGVPWAISLLSSSSRVMTPDDSGYNSAAAFSTATSAMKFDGVTSSQVSTNQLTMTLV
jgi:hypothetical protein